MLQLAQNTCGCLCTSGGSAGRPQARHKGEFGFPPNWQKTRGEHRAQGGLLVSKIPLGRGNKWVGLS